MWEALIPFPSRLVLTLTHTPDSVQGMKEAYVSVVPNLASFTLPSLWPQPPVYQLLQDFFFFFPSKQIKPQLFICSTKSARCAVCSSAGLGWCRKPAGCETEGELFYFKPVLFSMSKHISCLKRERERSEDLIPWYLKLKRKKRNILLFIQGGDIFLKGVTDCPRKKKNQVHSNPTFKFDPRHSL